MKKFILFFCATLFSISLYAQDVVQDEDATPSSSTSSSSINTVSTPSSSSSTYSSIIYCKVCRFWHRKPSCTPPPPPPTRAPIDGGLSLLLMAGAGYGIKKYKGRKSNQPKTL